MSGKGETGTTSNRPVVTSSASNARLASECAQQNEPADREKKIVNEFVYLLDKSKQLFNGLKLV